MDEGLPLRPPIAEPTWPTSRCKQVLREIAWGSLDDGHALGVIFAPSPKGRHEDSEPLDQLSRRLYAVGLGLSLLGSPRVHTRPHQRFYVGSLIGAEGPEECR